MPTFETSDGGPPADSPAGIELNVPETSAAASELLPQEYANVFVERLVIRNFRGLENFEIEFEPDLTVIAGRNNVGKSRILSALQLALGGRPADVDDFTLGSRVSPEIDVIIAPQTPANVDDDDLFSDSIGQLFSSSVQTTSEEPARERIGWRTHVNRSAEGFGAVADSRVLTYDDSTAKWVEVGDNPHRLMSNQRSALVAVDLINTNRDLIDEMSRRGSSIRRILSDLEVEESERSGLETELASLSQLIIGQSGTLTSITKALQQLHNHIGSIGAPSINALPISLEELTRSISVDLDMGRGSIPMRMHGAGSRSLASLQVQGVLYEHRLGRDGGTVRPQPVTLVEEPESHLHPQATLELADLIGALKGQKVVTTHSSHLITAVPPRAVRLLRAEASSLRAVDLGPGAEGDVALPRAFRPNTHEAEWQKLKRQVERPFGELVFASAIVIGDGATERAFLPLVIRHALGHRADGVTLIDPGSLLSDFTLAAVKFADLTGTPWLVFADSDEQGRKAVDAIKRMGHGDEHFVWVEVVDEEGNVIADATESMLLAFDEKMCRRACVSVRPDFAGSSDSTLNLMASMKGSSGTALARQLVDSYPETGSWPLPIRKLIARLEAELNDVEQ